jgi:iron complex outermembrane receptor protein
MTAGVWAQATQGFAQADASASAMLLQEVRSVIREHPHLADSQGNQALLEAVKRAASKYPDQRRGVAEAAKQIKPQLAAQIDEAMRPETVSQSVQPPAISNRKAEAKRVLLANVREVVAENPSLQDSVGDRALLAAVERSVQLRPELAPDITLLASEIKPHLSNRIELAAAPRRQPEPPYADTGAEEWETYPENDAVPEWAKFKRRKMASSRENAQDGDIFALGIEELMNTKVITASKSKERAFDVPAAITVITNEDIRRSGQTNVMEVLRMVPGMQVSRIHSSSWAISARGFADEYANKMLVLVDGRTVYTPTFSGTYWDLINMPMEDIDRIEVIRGPGASVWGANAVNGVINIVTKETKYTQGAYVSGGLGDHERAFGEGRVGGKIGDSGHYRFYSRYIDRDRMEDAAGLEQRNGWWRLLTGARADWTNKGSDSFTLQGEVQRGANEQESVQFGPVAEDSDLTMSYVRGKWVRALENGSMLNVNAFVDQHSRDTVVLDQQVTTFDVDMNHTIRWLDRNELVWGGGYRLMDDSYGNTAVLNYMPADDRKNLFNTFVQNKFEATDTLDLTLGTKIEHNDYTGFEIQPTAKAAYRPNEWNTLWMSVARAVRSPSRTEDSIRYVLQQLPTTPPTLIVGQGNTDVESEELIAYEMGYRISPSEGLIFDVSAYFNDYDNLTSLQQGAPVLGNGAVIVPLNVRNLGEAEMYGVEVSANMQVTPSWLLAGYYAYGHLEASGRNNNQLFLDYETLWPEHSFSVRSLYNISENVEFDTSLYYVGDLHQARDVNGGLVPIDAYLKWDVRLGWRSWDGLELSLVGLNLLEEGHQEFVDSRFYPASQIGRSYYGKATWRF